MKIPRDLSGTELIKKLEFFGYSITRQTGSHIRLTTMQNGKHHVTVPNHSNLRIGTLSSIINEIVLHIGKSKEEILNELFG